MNILLLAPKHGRDGSILADLRGHLARRITAAGHRPFIREAEQGEEGETLRGKFLRLVSECQQAVLIWPPAAAMGTTADELILLQEAHERHPLRIVLILHDAEVEQRGEELHVHFPHDQSRYLDGILGCDPYLLWWRGRPRSRNSWNDTSTNTSSTPCHDQISPRAAPRDR